MPAQVSDSGYAVGTRRLRPAPKPRPVHVDRFGFHTTSPHCFANEPPSLSRKTDLQCGSSAHLLLKLPNKTLSSSSSSLHHEQVAQSRHEQERKKRILPKSEKRIHLYWWRCKKFQPLFPAVFPERLVKCMEMRPQQSSQRCNSPRNRLRVKRKKIMIRREQLPPHFPLGYARSYFPTYM
jgi:hypothetical protein